MFLLLKLYLAHVIADFVLQFDELYRLKVKSQAGHWLHVAMHFGLTLLIVLPYLQFSFMWFFVAAVTLIHYGQDRIKYGLMENPRHLFPYFVLDQIFHFLFLTSILLFPVSRLEIGFPQHPALDFYYRNQHVTLLLILIFATTFGGAYLIHNFRKSYIPDTRPDHGISSFEMTHALIERLTITGLFLLAPVSGWLAAPAVGLLRLPFLKLRSWTDFGLSFAFAAGIGLLFRLWL